MVQVPTEVACLLMRLSLSILAMEDMYTSLEDDAAQIVETPDTVCVIDCGALAPTLLVKPIFDTLHTAMADHLSSNQNLKRRIIHKLHKDLCCEELSDDGRKNLPVATFHFEMLNLKPSSCFQTKQESVEELSDDGRKNLPGVTFHFENAGLDVKPEAVFMFREFEDCEKNG
ncbi:hypothetical protein POTOM_014609 [Populus tomentosa]|uniref:Uncharacterized protein n=1 Tax=Populus tomentosa TaxID=118781 RepID=A0A8X8A857_POPTO|nr:hypothetical protein POTOM_014609 [Populus tomentosa]